MQTLPVVMCRLSSRSESANASFIRNVIAGPFGTRFELMPVSNTVVAAIGD